MEFQIIKSFFAKQPGKRRDVIKGIGDDAAILKVPANHLLVVSMDTLVAGTHFTSETPAKVVGYKSLAVNLSDLAAMGAEAAWVTLSITLPKHDEKWLNEFTQGFFSLIKKHHLQLVGGDLTKGPLSITVQVHGFVPPKKMLYRSGAKIKDHIYVTGKLGGAGLAYQLLTEKIRKAEIPIDQNLLNPLYYPTPRLAEGIALRSLATSAIDISDGLAADLQHILDDSKVGATLFVDNVPLTPLLKQHFSLEDAWKIALSSGEDYELCFTTSPKHEKTLQNVFKKLNCPLSCIGVIEKKRGLRLQAQMYADFKLEKQGYQHF